MKSGSELIVEERTRQIDVEGFNSFKDSVYKDAELVNAAIAYLIQSEVLSVSDSKKGIFVSIKRSFIWPWNISWFKPTPDDRVKELVKAGALIAAEIDRIQNLK